MEVFAVGGMTDQAFGSLRDHLPKFGDHLFPDRLRPLRFLLVQANDVGLPAKLDLLHLEVLGYRLEGGLVFKHDLPRIPDGAHPHSGDQFQFSFLQLTLISRSCNSRNLLKEKAFHCL